MENVQGSSGGYPGSSFDFRMRKIDELKTIAPFEGLFPIVPATLYGVIQDMDNGYDRSQPIVIWQGRDIVIDGHTRLKAAKARGFAEIPVHEAHFDDEDAALDYAIHNQRDRRNLTDADITRLVELVHKKREIQRDDQGRFTVGSSEPTGRSVAQTAVVIGLSESKVKRTLKALSDPDAKESVLSGEKSINKAARDARDKAKSADAISALKGLGFKTGEAKEAVKMAIEQGETELEEIVRRSLQGRDNTPSYGTKKTGVEPSSPKAATEEDEHTQWQKKVEFALEKSFVAISWLRKYKEDNPAAFNQLIAWLDGKAEIKADEN